MTTTLCYPPGADWSCAYSDEELAEIEADPVQAANMDRANALAWMTLAALTGYQVGVCPITVRPCAAGCRGLGGTWLAAPVQSGSFAGVYPGAYRVLAPYVSPSGQWVNACGCGKSTDCSCTSLCEAILPGPVGSIVEVLLDGAVLDRSAYRVDNGDRLVRTDGGCWPVCQDMSAPSTPVYAPAVRESPTGRATFNRTGDTVTVLVEPTEPFTPGGFLGPVPWLPISSQQIPLMDARDSTFQVGIFQVNKPPQVTVGGGAGTAFAPVTFSYTTTDPPAPVDRSGTFSVRYYRGAAPNPMTLWAAGVLAVEFFLACSGKDCRLPAGVTSVSRQGMSFEIQTGLFVNGYTGIPEVDAVIGLYNPHGLRSGPVIASPDSRKPRIQTWGR